MRSLQGGLLLPSFPLVRTLHKHEEAHKWTTCMYLMVNGWWVLFSAHQLNGDGLHCRCLATVPLVLATSSITVVQVQWFKTWVVTRRTPMYDLLIRHSSAVQRFHWNEKQIHWKVFVLVTERLATALDPKGSVCW